MTTSMMDLKTIDEEIKRLEEEIFEKEKQATEFEKRADELDGRAMQLKASSLRHKTNGVLWGVFNTYVGIALAPFTAGTSLALGLASAGYGAKLSFDSAEDCERHAEAFRMEARKFREDAAAQSKKRDQLQIKRKDILSSYRR